MAYRNLGAAILDFLYDVKGISDRTIAVSSKVLEQVHLIVSIWSQDNAYLESQKDLTFAYAKLRDYPKIDNFITYYGTLDFRKNVKSLTSKYKNELNARIAYIYYCYQKQGITISLEDAAKIAILLDDYNSKKHISEIIRENLIALNYNSIYSSVQMINLIRYQNGMYKRAIGDYEKLDDILGVDGSKIRDKDPETMEYISSFEDVERELESVISKYELDKRMLEKPDFR